MGKQLTPPQEDKTDTKVKWAKVQRGQKRSTEKEESPKENASDERYEKMLPVLLAVLIVFMLLFIANRYFLKQSRDEISAYYQIADMANSTAAEGKGKQESSETVININTADKNELMKLKGIGEKKANQIIEHRNIHGKFNKIEDIMDVNGIGEKTFEGLKNSITVEEQAE